MIEPTDLPIELWIGSAFDQEFQFWQDSAQTEPYDFSPWTVTAGLLSANIVNSGTAFDVNVEGGSVTLSLSKPQTDGLNERSNTRYAITMTLTDEPDVSYYVVMGEVTFKRP